MSGSPLAPLVVCMGVSGSGKTTLATQLASHLDAEFVEADDFHPAENKSRMRRGLPLTDAHREPWMAAILEGLQRLASQDRAVVLAHSALRTEHRQKLRETHFDVVFLHLCLSPSLAQERVLKRGNHFMPADLVDSQFEALQPPEGEIDVFLLDAALEPEALYESALHALRPSRRR